MFDNFRLRRATRVVVTACTAALFAGAPVAALAAANGAGAARTLRSFDTETSYANVYTATSDMELSQVGTFVAADTTVTTQVYLLPDTAAEPDDGVLVAEQTHSKQKEGYQALQLDEPVAVQEGQRFSIVQTQVKHGADSGSNEAGDRWLVPLEGDATQPEAPEGSVDADDAAKAEDTASDGAKVAAEVDASSSDGVAEAEDQTEAPAKAENAGLVGVDGAWKDADELESTDGDSAADGTNDAAPAQADVALDALGTVASLPSEGSIDILHTNDTHGFYQVYDGDGKNIVNPYTAMNALAQDADLVLDAGDTFHGDNFATVSKGSNIAELMAAVGYDATTPGNHDWSYGAEHLAELAEEGDLAMLAANVLDKKTGEPYFGTPYITRDVALSDDYGNSVGKTVRVGVLGVTDESFYTSTPAYNVEGLEFTDPVAKANEVAAELREERGVDIVIVIAHHTDPTGLASQLSGVDAVVAGHEHISIAETVKGADGRDVAVVEVPSNPAAGGYFRMIGMLTLDVSADDGTITDREEQQMWTFDHTREDAEIDALTKRLEEESAALLNEVVGTSSRDYAYATEGLPGGWELVRTEDTAIGHLVTGSYLAKTGADLAFENAGGIRAGITAGDVTAGDLIEISPYGNTLATYSLTGAQVLTAIEHSLDIMAECRDVLAKQVAAIEAGEDPWQYEWPGNSGSVLAVGGATIEVDWSRPSGERVRSITVGGKALDADKTYTVAMNSYLATSTDEYPTLADQELVAEWGTCEEALRALVSTTGWEQKLDEISGSMTFVDGSDDGPGDEDPTPGTDPTDPGNTGKKPTGGLPQTGDDSLMAIVAVGGIGAVVVIAGVAVALRRRA